MASFDDLDAPQYSNFKDFDQEKAEQYFEIDHESEITESGNNDNVECPEKSLQEDHFYSPINTDSVSSDGDVNVLQLRNRRVRRSSSVDRIEIPTKQLANMCVNKNEKKLKPLSEVKESFQYGILRKGNASSQSKLRFCSQESLNRLAAPKMIHSSMGNLAKASSQEYVSVAEAVRRFHEKTPNRYHTQNKNNHAPSNPALMKLKATVPISPRLLTKKRVKMNEHVLSHEERMQIEFEKEQKFKIKANPVNKKILQPMKAVHVEKKPATVPEPFKLTEVENKKKTPKKEEYRFHARPIPKILAEPPKLPKKQELKLTKPVTPTFIKKMPPKPSSANKEIEKPKPVRTTKPEPFSFEKRDMKLMKKKEELVKKVIEEEKKAREFHARPIPKPVASLINKQKQKGHYGSNSSLNRSDSFRSEHEEPFKAKPPTVLYQKPFVPKKLETPLTEIQPFTLTSEQRARERELFEQKKREQEESIAAFLQQEEEKQRKRDEEEARRIREETKFKAQPIRNFKGVVIQPSNKVTEPISPVFLSGKSKRNNKENLM